MIVTSIDQEIRILLLERSLMDFLGLRSFLHKRLRLQFLKELRLIEIIIILNMQISKISTIWKSILNPVAYL